MKVLVQIKKIAGKKINTEIFKLPEATMWTDMDVIGRVVLRVKRVKTHYEFSRDGIVYKMIPIKELDEALDAYYSDVEWCSLLKFLVKSPMI